MPIKEQNILSIIIGAVLMIYSPFSVSGAYTNIMQEACPRFWELSTYKPRKDFPDGSSGDVDYENYIRDYFGGINADEKAALRRASQNPELWGDAVDRAKGMTHMERVRPIRTITHDDSVTDDPLTVASECMVYLNIEIDSLLSPGSASSSGSGSDKYGWLVPIISQ